MVKWQSGDYTFDPPPHLVPMIFWIISTVLVLLMTRFRCWWTYLLLVLLPVAIWPLQSWFYIVFRILKAPIGP